MAKKQADYGNESITMLKGADKVRKRPGVIFGSDGLDGCEHSVFEVISNSIDEARAGFGDHIIVTRYQDQTIEVQDFGRGCPVDYNNTEKRYNWELVYCELYAGGKYDAEGDTYAYSLGLNGLGLCATQFASEFMDVEIFRDGFRYNLHFEHGNNVGGLKKEPTTQKKPVPGPGGSRIWMYSRISRSRTSFSTIFSGGRQSSIRTCCLPTGARVRTAAFLSGNSGTKTALPTMCRRSWETRL